MYLYSDFVFRIDLYNPTAIRIYSVKYIFDLES